MGYYTDLDNDRGVDLEVSEHMREQEYERRIRETNRKRSIRNEVKKQLSKAGINTDKKPTRGAKVEVSCACCGNKFLARVADRKRGWAKFCSKSCKARKQKNNLF